MKTLQFLLKYLYAPALLAGGNCLAFVLISHRRAVWLPALLLAAVAVSLLVERAIPYCDEWNVENGDGARDWTHALVNEGCYIAGIAAIPVLSAWLPWPPVWPLSWPLGAQWLFAVLVADAGITLMHWLSHRVEWLWRFHAVHHSVERMYGLNGLLKHPAHQAIEALAGTAPLLLMGLPLEVGELLAASVALQLLLQHSNADMRIGPLRHVLALAPLHRFHHQKWAGVGDVNFGLFTTFWDRLLGTAVYDPARRFGPGDVGIGTKPNYPRTYLAQLLEPFRRQTKN